MSICLIVENPDATREDAERVMSYVRSSGSIPPEGARLVMMGQDEGTWRVVSVWDSQEAQERFFAERLAPAYREAGLSLDDVKRTRFELHTLVAGDLTGAPQPA